MNRTSLITTATALLVFVVGTGLGRVNGPSTEGEFHVLARDADGRPIPTLPTVFVSANVNAENGETDPAGSFDSAVTNARSAIAGRVNSGIRRVGLAIPYYAFGRNARSE